MEITLTIADDSALARDIERISETQQLSHEEVALQLIEGAHQPRAANPDAYKIIGMFSSPEDVAIVDEAMELIMEERHRRNSAPPRD